MRGRKGRTGLADDAYLTALAAVLELLEMQDRITNSGLRSLTGLNYDQAIKFFKRATLGGALRRRGSGSGTYYVRTDEAAT